MQEKTKEIYEIDFEKCGERVKKKMMMAVMRQGPLNWGPYPRFLCGTPQTTPKAQFPGQVCFTVSSREVEEDREGVVKKMSKNNISQRLASIHFKLREQLKLDVSGC